METMRKDWRYYLGLSLFAYSFLPILTIELVGFLPMTATQAVAFGAVYLGSGEAAFLLAIALLGKPFIEAAKAKIYGFFKRAPRPAVAKPVGKARHYFGVFLFFASFLPYVAAEGLLIFGKPDAAGLRGLLWLLLSGDAVFIVSLFVLGEAFWRRLKALFVWPGIEGAAE